MKKIEQKEILFLLFQLIGIISLFMLEGLFWFIFGLNIIILLVGVVSIFSVKLNKKSLIDNSLHMVMPLIYFLGVIFFLTTVKSVFLQVALLGLYVFSNYVFIKNIEEIRNEKKEGSLVPRNIVSMISLLSVFFVITDLVNAYIFYSVPKVVFLLLAFGIVWLITYFLFSAYGLLDNEEVNVRSYIFLGSFMVMEILWVGSFWIVNYPFSKIGELGISLLAMVSLISYYAFWGISHHKLTNTLTKKVLYEYIIISSLIIFVILLTTKWLPEGVVG